MTELVPGLFLMQGSYTRQFTAWLESCQQAFLFLFCVLTWLIFRITSYLTAWRFHGECQWQPFIQEDFGLTSETLKNCSCSWWTWSAVPLLGCIGRIWWCSLHLNWAWNNTWVGRIVLAVLKAIFQNVASWMLISESGNESWSDCTAPGWRTAASVSCYVSKIFSMTFYITSILPLAASEAQSESFLWYQVGWLLLMAFSSLPWLKRPVSLFQRIWASYIFYTIKKGKLPACLNAKCSRKPK